MPTGWHGSSVGCGATAVATGWCDAAAATDGDTAVHVAAECGHLEVAELLNSWPMEPDSAEPWTQLAGVSFRGICSDISGRIYKMRWELHEVFQDMTFW